MGILGVDRNVGVVPLKEKRPVTTRRWFLKSEKEQGRGGGREGQRCWSLAFDLLVTALGKGFREGHFVLK